MSFIKSEDRSSDHLSVHHVATTLEPGEQPATELDTFLPTDGSSVTKDPTRMYKVQILPAKTQSKDGEANHHTRKGYWDPFKERRLEHPTTDGETLTHLLKASLGTGILTMPAAFKNAGMLTGVICTVILSLICTHCMYVLVKCAHALYHRKRVTTMSFADVGEVAFANGPSWGRRYSRHVRIFILSCLFLTFFGTCSVYTVIIAGNFKKVMDYHVSTDYQFDVRYYIAFLLPPLILLSWIPNLKYLAPISLLANALMASGLGITFWYLIWDLPSVWERPQFGSWATLPNFFSTTMFALIGIGMIMPLENAMGTPQHFLGLFGVLNRGMGGVTITYILLGFLGYLKYGDDVDDNITESLPVQEIAPQVANVFLAIAVFCTFALQFFVCFEIVWGKVKGYFPKQQNFYNYIVRTVLVTASVVMGIVVPLNGPFMGLIGAFCLSCLGLIIPVLIELTTFWDVGFGRFNWVLWKNIIILILGFLALIFGSYTSLKEIVAMYVGTGAALPTRRNVTEGIFSGANETSHIVSAS